MSPLTPRERYSRRTEELRSLSVQVRPEDPGPVVAQVLAAAGDLLRRALALRPDLAAVDAALRGLPDAALTRWRDGVAVPELEGRLQRAVAFAVDAALPDDAGDADALCRWSMQGLQARDQLESTLVALERLAGLGRPQAAVVAGALRAEAERVDRACSPAVAGLTPVNHLRRPEAALLDDAERTRAWWFSARSGVEDDALVPVLGGERPGTLAPLDRLAGEVVSDSQRRPVSSAALLRLDLGLASEAEVRAVRRRAQDDPELELALAALEAGEAAILALEQGEAAEPAPGPAGRVSQGPDALHQHPDFKVLVFRSRRVMRVVVEPRREERLVAAALRRPEGGPGGLQATPGPDGLEFEVPGSLRGAVRLVVTLGSGAQAGLDFTLE
jgi:hypothetical protein